MEEFKINLRDLFTKNRSELSDWIDFENVIYRIHNLVNDKSYVGQAKWFYGRLVIYEGLVTNHYVTYINASIDGSRYYPILYRALCKYKSRNFEVTILEYNVVDLNEREKYWIKELHTCIYDSECWGYNMTWGGEDCSNLNMPKIRRKVYSTQFKRYGCLAFNTEEAKLKSLETRINKYGSANGPLCSDEVRYKRLKAISDRYNGDCAGQLHTEEAKRLQRLNSHTEDAELRRQSTNRANHGGVLAWNTDESIKKSLDTRTKLYGDPCACMNTPEIQKKQLETKAKNYNGDLFGQAHGEKSYEINRANHGGVLAMHTKEARDKALKIKASYYNGDCAGQLHTAESQFKGLLSRWFYFSDKYTISGKTIENYWNNSTWKHIYFLRDNYDILIKDPRWTKFHQEFYDYIIDRV